MLKPEHSTLLAGLLARAHSSAQDPGCDRKIISVIRNIDPAGHHQGCPPGGFRVHRRALLNKVLDDRRLVADHRAMQSRHPVEAHIPDAEKVGDSTGSAVAPLLSSLI